MGRSQRHKIEEQGYTSRGQLYEQGAINDEVLKAMGGELPATALESTWPVLEDGTPLSAVHPVLASPLAE